MRRVPRTRTLLGKCADTRLGQEEGQVTPEQFVPASAHRMMEMCQKDTDQFPLVESRANGAPEDSNTMGGNLLDRTEPVSPQTEITRDVSVCQRPSPPSAY